MTDDVIVARCSFSSFLVPAAPTALKGTPTQFLKGKRGNTQRVFGSEALRIEDAWPRFDFAPAEIRPCRAGGSHSLLVVPRQPVLLSGHFE